MPTARKKPRRKLRKKPDRKKTGTGRLSFSLLRQAVRHTNDGVVITDARRRDNPIIYANPAFERITGYTAAEALGRNCRFLQGKERRQQVLAEVRESLREKRPCLVTVRNYRKDGTLFFNELSISPVFSSRGVLTHHVGVLKDVSTRVQAEERATTYLARLKRANRRLQELATTDSLTGLLNRRQFVEEYGREWRRSVREQKSLAVLMFDVDFFKPFNDTYGHQAGDQCLRTLANVMATSLRRPSDIAARYGGEEFVAVMTDVKVSDALAMAERIRRRLMRCRISHRKSKVSKYVTLSAGVTATIPDRDADPEEIVRRADDALYRAKELGRNRVVLAM